MLDSQSKPYWILFLVAAASFLPTLGFYYTGEEAIFPIVSQEMWQRGDWLRQYLYGQDLQHNPLFNWLIMPISALAGWEHVLLVTRAITISVTLGTALTLGWLAQRLFGNKVFAAFAALGYLTMADVLIWHGWLSYVDPLFGFFIFAAIAVLWVGVLEQRLALLAAAGALLTCAFLSKAFTAYVFYAGTLFVLCFEAKSRAFLLRWQSLLIHAATLAAPFVWFMLLPRGDAQGVRMFAEILSKLSATDISAYLVRLVAYPTEVLFSLAPLPVLALYFWLRKRVQLDLPEHHHLFVIACWIALLNFLPYWLTPQGGMRYIIPIYPLLALVAARLIWQSGATALDVARKWIIATLVLKFVAALIIFPYYQSHVRGQSYDEAAADILKMIDVQPIYIHDFGSPGLNVTAYINQRRYPAEALQVPPAQWSSGYVLAPSPDDALGEVIKKYKLGGDEIYLLCRGSACASKNVSPGYPPPAPAQ